MDEEVGATEVIGRGEPGVSDVDGIVGVLRVLGLFFGVVGQLVELLVVRCHVPCLDIVGDTEHRANVRASSEGQAQGDQEIEVERRVGAQRQGRCLGGVAGAGCRLQARDRSQELGDGNGCELHCCWESLRVLKS